MKIILCGHEESKKILPASSWLLNKYVRNYDIRFLNYGSYDGELETGKYVMLDEIQKDGVRSWSKYIREYLKDIDDEFIIFALDDFFISEEMRPFIHNEEFKMTCICDSWSPNNVEYSCTAQYTIWDRKLLIEVLEQVETPWEFELEGSKYINEKGICPTLEPVLTYSDESAMSVRHLGKVSVKGLIKEDIETLIKKGYLNREELIIGQPMGKVKQYD